MQFISIKEGSPMLIYGERRSTSYRKYICSPFRKDLPPVEIIHVSSTAVIAQLEGSEGEPLAEQVLYKLFDGNHDTKS